MDTVDDPRPAAAEQEGGSPRTDGGERRVVVGVDGSPGARAAMALALVEAAQRRAVLEVVSAFPVSLVWTGGAPIDVPDVAGVRAAIERQAQELADEVRRSTGAPAVHVRVVAQEGRPVPALLTAAEGAELLVVGSRGRSALRSALLGSVALHCVSSAPCPVIVVHGDASPSQPPHVVVGVDGAQISRPVIMAALDEAVRSGAHVDVVACYAVTDYWMDLGTVVIPTVEQIRHDLLQATDSLVQGIVAERADDAVPAITVHVVEGAAGDVLVGRSRDASLLVVGSHGRGAVRGLVLGSVALHCAMHSAAPVMVVHEQRTRSTVPEPRPERVLADR